MKQKIIIFLCVAGVFALLTACSGTSNTSGNATSNVDANMSSDATSNVDANPVSNSGENPMVGGSAMSKEKDMVDNATHSKDHTTLVAGIKSTDLAETLKGAGPFTVFAPTNAAFEKLPAGIVDSFLQSENKRILTNLLNYHVVPGKQDVATIVKAIEAGGGKATFKTVQGAALTASMDGKDIILTDEIGGVSKITVADVMQSNGVVHIVDSVLMLNNIGLL